MQQKYIFAWNHHLRVASPDKWKPMQSVQFPHRTVKQATKPPH